MMLGYYWIGIAVVGCSIVILPAPSNSQGTSNPTRKTKPAREKCEEGNVYRFLAKCKQDCEGFVHPNDNDHIKAAQGGYAKTVSHYSYKLLVLDKDEFTNQSGQLLLTGTPQKYNFSDKYFIVKDEKAYLCFPMPDDFKHCEVQWLLEPDEYDFRNGNRKIWVSIHKKHYDVTEFAHRKQDNTVAVCAPEKTMAQKSRNTALLTAWFLSLICLGVLMVLAQMFPILNMKNNKILLCNLSVLFVAYLTLTIKQLVPALNTGACVFMAYFQQYMFLSAFCWINVQAIDVFLKFIQLRVNHADKKQEQKKFILYSIHGWVTPFTITFITGMVEVSKSPILNPMMAKSCWFQKKDTGLSFLYFYGPISIILVINMVLFVITVYKLCTVGKGSNIKKGAKIALFIVYIKLVFVMGLSWTMEVISVAVGGDDQHWNYPDMINALQGVFIFITYTFKRIFMRRLFVLVCRHPKCPACWPLKPLPMPTNGIEGTCSTANSSGGTLPRTSQAVTMNKL